jgi:ABC-2 type transport system ATP-binding protein
LGEDKLLHVHGISKSYGDLNAVEDLSFSLAPGDVFGFIGSNGAGKTTTIKMIATLLEPSSGTAWVNGFDVVNQPMEVRRHIGYMPDFFGLYDDIKVWEYLDFFANMYQVAPKQRREVIDNVLELTDLTMKKQAFVQTLSRGMQQRLCLARCLVHDPTLLLLDEPASGLDPRARAELKHLINLLGSMGKIVVVSSHILPELADFCNTVGIIERGHMLAFGPVSEVIKSCQTSRTINIRFTSAVRDAELFLETQPHITALEVSDSQTVTLGFTGDLDGQAALLQALIVNGHRVIDFREHHADLEDIFLQITTGAVQ